MFRRWPFFQRLLSWTKPYAPADRHSREFERWDWNSLLAKEPELRGLQAEFMDGSSDFPSRPEMEANLGAFASGRGSPCATAAPGNRRAGKRALTVRASSSSRATASTAARHLIFAVGVAEPYSPATPGIELAVHYADTRGAETYAGKRLFIIGKQNSGFELASGLLQWASRITLSSPSPAKTSIETRSLVGVRARYVQPFEDSALGGGVDILAASIDGISKSAGGLRVDLKRSDNGLPVSLEVDEVISATGFTCPLQDLPAPGRRHVRPEQAAGADGVLGIGDRARDPLRRDDHAGLVGAQEARHPELLGGRPGAPLQRSDPHPAARRDGTSGSRPRSPRSPSPDLRDYLLAEATRAPELWHQKAYLARVVSVSPDDGIRDRGILPLTHFLDSEGPDAVAMTVEADGQGAIYPVAYVRRGGKVEEHALEPHPLNDYEGSAYRRHLGAILDLIAPGASAA